MQISKDTVWCIQKSMEKHLAVAQGLVNASKKVKDVEKAKFRSGYKLTTGDLEVALFQWVTTVCAFNKDAA